MLLYGGLRARLFLGLDQLPGNQKCLQGVSGPRWGCKITGNFKIGNFPWQLM